MGRRLILYFSNAITFTGLVDEPFLQPVHHSNKGWDVAAEDNDEDDEGKPTKGNKRKAAQPAASSFADAPAVAADNHKEWSGHLHATAMKVLEASGP